MTILLHTLLGQLYRDHTITTTKTSYCAALQSLCNGACRLEWDPKICHSSICIALFITFVRKVYVMFGKSNITIWPPRVRLLP